MQYCSLKDAFPGIAVDEHKKIASFVEPPPCQQLHQFENIKPIEYAENLQTKAIPKETIEKFTVEPSVENSSVETIPSSSLSTQTTFERPQEINCPECQRRKKIEYNSSINSTFNEILNIVLILLLLYIIIYKPNI
jgi:hypothetical protein